MFMPSLGEGQFWEDNQFKFDWVRREEDRSGDMSDEERTTDEIVKAMCSLVPFLEFTGESASMFSNRRLPTIDVEI